MQDEAKEERLIIRIRRAQIEEMLAHAREEQPQECCGLVGGRERAGQTVYRLRNIAPDPLVAYDGDPRGLAEAQRAMRGRGEQLLAIYHSHPREANPVPSETDVRLAYHPAAVYFIIGKEDETNGQLPGASLGAFRLFRSEKRWEGVEYAVVEN